MSTTLRAAALALAGLIAIGTAGDAEARRGGFGHGGGGYGRVAGPTLRDHRLPRPVMVRSGTVVRDHRTPAPSPYRPPDYRDPGRAPGGVVVRTPRVPLPRR